MPLRPSPAALRCASLVALGAVSLCRPASAAADTDLVKAAMAHGGFKTFLGFVSRAGLADTLGASPVTVFMPTDGAFARLSAAQRRSIAALSPDGVKAFVGRFVFTGGAMASNDVDKTITSESGTTYDVTWYRGRLSLRDDRGPATSRLAYVVQGDIPAGPGLIDAVDAVLMPAATGGLAVPVSSGPKPTTSAADPAASPAPATPTAAPGTSAVPGSPAPTPVPAPATGTSPAASETPPVAPGSAAPPGKPSASPDQPPAVPAPAPVLTTTPPIGLALPANSANSAKSSAGSSDTPAVAPKPALVRPKGPEIGLSAAGLRGWPLKVSGHGSTGRVKQVMIDLPDGRVTGVSAHFGGFLGFGGRTVYVPWDRIAPDDTNHVLRARMTAAEFASAPATPPKP